MREFVEAGEREREFLDLLAKKTGLSQMIMMPPSCPYDALGVTPTGKVAIFEAKVRLMRHDKFDSTLIEYPKYSDLMTRLSKQECHRVYYVEFYTDGCARIYNLARIDDISWGNAMLNLTTMGSLEDTRKRVGYIDYGHGKVVEIPNNIFE